MKANTARSSEAEIAKIKKGIGVKARTGRRRRKAREHSVLEELLDCYRLEEPFETFLRTSSAMAKLHIVKSRLIRWFAFYGSSSLFLSSDRMLSIMTANDPIITAIEAKSSMPNMFSPILFTSSCMRS